MSDIESTNQEEPRGDDGLTDDERRLAKQRARDAEQRKVDAAGDAERARQEEANGETPGTRGRVVAAPAAPVKATSRKTQSK